MSVFIFIPDANAYVDPNLGGTLFQMLMPILAVLLGFVAFA